MACCALAAFLIGQILLFWERLGATGSDGARVAQAAAWRPGQTAALQPPRRNRRRLGAGLAAAGVLGMAGAAYAASGPAEVELGATGIMVPVCGDMSLLESMF